MHPDHGTIAERALLGLAIHVTTCIVQVIFLIFTLSLALVSDTIHVIADGLALWVLWLSQKQADSAHREVNVNLDEYYHREEVRGTAIIGALLFATAFLLLPFALHRYSDPPEISAVIWVPGVLGFVGNVSVLWIIRGHHKHRTVQSALAHIALDMLGSVGVVIAGVLIWWSGESIFDPLVSFFIIGLMILAGLGFMYEAVTTLRKLNNAGGH